MINLTKREKILGYIMVLLSILFSLYVFAVEPAVKRINTLNRVIPRKENELNQIRKKADEYKKLNTEAKELRAQIDSQKEEIELLPLLETTLKDCGLSKNIATMKQHILPLDEKYEKKMVEIHLEKLSLAQLVDFLSKTRSSNKLVKINTLHIKKNQRKSQMLNAAVEVYVVKPL